LLAVLFLKKSVLLVAYIFCLSEWSISACPSVLSRSKC
jgi:hypothetical protein